MLTTIKVNNHLRLNFEAPTLGCAKLICGAFGYEDVDVEPMGDFTKVTASSRNHTTLSFKGATVHEACQKLIETLAGTL